MKVTLNSITKPIVADVLKMNMEEYLIYAARVSSDERVNNDTAPGLMKYLIKHKHWSPFEMVHIGIEIQTSRAIAAQILRHRSFSFQEFSQRYAKVSSIESVELRYKADTNRQSSTSVVEDAKLNKLVSQHMQVTQKLYDALVKADVATECARMILPLATSTNIVMVGSVRSWIHFFEQRCSEHAQKEIQDIAYAARDLVAFQCPWLAKALEWDKSVEGWDKS